MNRSRFAALTFTAAAVCALVLWFLLGRGPAAGPAPTPAETAAARAGRDEAAPAPPSGPVAPAWVLTGYGSVVGTLREYGTDRPLSGVRVLLRAGVPGPGEEIAATTQSDGSFAFPRAARFDAWTFVAPLDAPLAQLELAGVAVDADRATDLGVLYATPGFQVRGVVVDDRGAPIPGAAVRAIRARPRAGRMDFLRVIREIDVPPPSVDAATTGPDGRFVLSRVPPGTYDFEIRARGFAQALERGLVITPEGAARDLRFVLPRGFPLSGRVIRKSEGPIEGLPVIAFEQPESDMAVFDLNKRTTVTDDTGEFHLEGLSPGTASLVVRPTGEPFALILDIAIPAQDYVEVVIEGDAWLEGRIVDVEDKAVAGAQVYVLNFDGSPPMVGVAVTDGSGAYRISGLKSGPVQVFMVQAEGFGTYPADVMALLMGRSSELVLQKGGNRKDVRLEAGGIVRGSVLEQGTDGPVEGVKVSLAAPSSMFGGVRTTTTGPDGAFEIRSVPLGPAMLICAKDGWFQPGVTPQTMITMAMSSMGGAKPDTGEGAVIRIETPGAEVERTLHLSRGVTFAGRVVDAAGQPIPGARVLLQFASTGRGFMRELNNFFPLGEARLTDNEGAFSIPAPAPGQKVRILARAQGFLETASEDLTVAKDGSAPAAVEIRMRSGASVEGRVLDAAGKPVETALVRLAKEEDGDDWGRQWRLRQARPTQTDRDGRFRVENVETGRMSVQIEHARYRSASVTGVETAEGRAASVEVRLEAGLALRGNVVGPNGRPFGGARVEVTFHGEVPPGGDPYFRPRDDLVTDGGGNFLVEGLYPGLYTLEASAKGVAPSGPVEVEAGAPALTLRLGQAYLITGTVKTRDGVALSNVRVHAERVDGEDRERVESVNTNRDGRFEIHDLPGGNYEILAEAGWGFGSSRPNLRPKRIPDVPAGTQNLAIEVEEGLRVAGRVTLIDGTPVAEGWASVNSRGEGGGNTNGPILEGAFDLSGVAPGKADLWINVPDQSPKHLEVEAGKTDLVIVLGGGGTVTGRILLPDGSPAGGAWVSAQQGDGGSTSVQAGPDGAYVLKGVGPGRFRVQAGVQVDEKHLGGQTDEMDIAQGGTLTGVDVELRGAE